MRKILAPLFALAFTLLAHVSLAAGPYYEGQHYTRLANPVSAVRPNPNKIEVVEVFSYDCPHCMAFEPIIQKWKAQLPDYVSFVPMQAQWDAYRTKLARAQLTAKALKVSDKIHPAIYTAIQIPGQRPNVLNDDKIEQLFTSNGVDAAKFEKTFHAFGIDSQLKQYKEKIAAYGVNSTPQLIVNGEYVISATREIDHQAMLDIADYLVGQIRAERGFE